MRLGILPSGQSLRLLESSQLPSASTHISLHCSFYYGPYSNLTMYLVTPLEHRVCLYSYKNGRLKLVLFASTYIGDSLVPRSPSSLLI